MKRALHLNGDKSTGCGSTDLGCDRYSSDYHLLILLFGPVLDRELSGYASAMLVSDIINLERANLKQTRAVVILCELERYSPEEVAPAVNLLSEHRARVFVLSTTNLTILNNYGTCGPENVSLLSLHPERATPFSKLAGEKSTYFAVDLHSSRLPIDTALLLPRPPAAATPDSVDLDCTRSTPPRRRSLGQVIRYPLAVTKRHVKNCVQELASPWDEPPASQPAQSPAADRSSCGALREHGVKLEGTVFLSVAESSKYGSDWPSLVTAFCASMRTRADATLVLWVSDDVSQEMKADFHHMLCTVAPFECSVALIQGELNSDELYNLFSAASVLINAEIYRRPRLDLVAAACRGLHIISPLNSSIEANHRLVGCALETDEQPASPDRSTNPKYSTRHFKVIWQDLHRRITEGYQSVNHDSAQSHTPLLRSNGRSFLE